MLWLIIMGGILAFFLVLVGYNLYLGLMSMYWGNRGVKYQKGYPISQWSLDIMMVPQLSVGALVSGLWQKYWWANPLLVLVASAFLAVGSHLLMLRWQRAGERLRVGWLRRERRAERLREIRLRRRSG